MHAILATADPDGYPQVIVGFATEDDAIQWAGKHLGHGQWDYVQLRTTETFRTEAEWYRTTAPD